MCVWLFPVLFLFSFVGFCFWRGAEGNYHENVFSAGVTVSDIGSFPLFLNSGSMLYHEAPHHSMFCVFLIITGFYSQFSKVQYRTYNRVQFLFLKAY